MHCLVLLGLYYCMVAFWDCVHLYMCLYVRVKCVKGSFLFFCNSEYVFSRYVSSIFCTSQYQCNIYFHLCLLGNLYELYCCLLAVLLWLKRLLYPCLFLWYCRFYLPIFCCRFFYILLSVRSVILYIVCSCLASRRLSLRFSSIHYIPVPCFFFICSVIGVWQIGLKLHLDMVSFIVCFTVLNHLSDSFSTCSIVQLVRFFTVIFLSSVCWDYFQLALLNWYVCFCLT